MPVQESLLQGNTVAVTPVGTTTVTGTVNANVTVTVPTPLAVSGTVSVVGPLGVTVSGTVAVTQSTSPWVTQQTVGRSSVRTYSCTATSSPTAASSSFPSSGALSITPIMAFVSSGNTATVNANTVDIEQIIINLSFNGGSGKPLFDIILGTCSGFVGGTAQAIYAHDQSDAVSSMQYLQLPTSVGATAWKLFDVGVFGTPSATTYVLTRNNFPGGKPIRLQVGQAQGLYVYILNSSAASFANTGFVATVTTTWTES